MKQVLEMKLMEFLYEVMTTDIDLEILDPEADLFEFFDFYGEEFENPTEAQAQRVVEVCQLETPTEDLVNEIWKSATRSHYEYTYTADYLKHIQDWITEKLEDDFKVLADFFMDEAEDFGISDVSPTDELAVKVDWEANKLTITGNLTVLEASILSCLRGYGFFSYDSYDDFKEAYGSDTQQERIISHLGWLKQIEPIYGSSHDFFTIQSLASVHDCYSLGDFSVTDLDLQDAYSCIMN